MPGIDSLTRATKALCAQSLDDVQVDIRQTSENVR